MDVGPVSIDAIVEARPEEVEAVALAAQASTSAADSQFPTSARVVVMVPPSPSAERLPGHEGLPEMPRSKGKKRHFFGLHRISSSPSLARIMGSSSPSPSSSSPGYRNGHRASMSCVSLASAPSTFIQSSNSLTSYDSESVQQYSTAPTSAQTSAGPATPTLEERPRLCAFGKESAASVGLPANLRPVSPLSLSEVPSDSDEAYFSDLETAASPTNNYPRRPNFNFWNDMPSELRMHILSFLTPSQVVRCSAVCKSWHTMCFDGQLWRNIDMAEYYSFIPAEALVNIISSAGPFLRDLNLRGCVQLRDRWLSDNLPEACGNLENFSLEGCPIDLASIQGFLQQNNRLVHINLSGLHHATNAAMKVIAQNCPRLEHLNVTWCLNVDTRGLRRVVQACPNLKDLRAGETRGWDDVSFANELFERNTLERLILTNCESLNDDALTAMIIGLDGEIDYLTGRVVCPARNLKHLDLTRCRGLSDNGIKSLAHNVPNMEGLQLSKCSGLTDASLTDVLPTLPMLTHLDLEELENITNATLQSIAGSSAAVNLRHLSISYCENLGDSGMIPLLKTARKIESLDMDNTRVSDLVLMEATSLIRERNRQATRECRTDGIQSGLRMVVYDCANITWTGIREILSRNTELMYSTSQFASKAPLVATFAIEDDTPPASSTSAAPTRTDPPKPTHYYIALKAFYTWQPTINEHTKRLQRGDFVAARRLERKWAEWMMAGEEAANGGRRRRRRMREAMEAIDGEEVDGGIGLAGTNRRRRARSGPVGGAGGSCVVM